MKIADYGKAITSYIESPTTAQKLQAKEKAQTLGRTLLAEGSEDIVEPSKSMQVDTTTKGLDLFTIDNFKDKAEIYVGALYNGALPTADIKSALNKFTQKGIDDGTFTADEAIKVVQDLKYQFKDRAQKQRLRDVIIEGTGTVEREDFQRGGFRAGASSKPLTKEKFTELYKKFLKSKAPDKTDRAFAEVLNKKGFRTQLDEPFGPDSVQIRRSKYGIKGVAKVGTDPTKQAQVDKINNYLSELIPKLNSENKFYAYPEVREMVLKKLKLPATTTLDQRYYPQLKVGGGENSLLSRPEKIDLALNKALASDKPLNTSLLKYLKKETGVSDAKIFQQALNNSSTYQSIKDQGGDLLKNRFNQVKELYDLSLSDALTRAVDLEKGQPIFTGMGKEKYFSSSPKHKIMDFAKRNWNANQGNGPVKFFDNKGKEIKWQRGTKLPYNKVSFKFNGKTYNTKNLNNIEMVKKDFPEVYKKQIAVNRLRATEVDNPFKKGTKIPLLELLKLNSQNIYGWKSKRNTFDVLHGPKGVAVEPFTNLSFNSRDVNQMQLGIDTSVRAGKIKQSDANKILKFLNEYTGSGDVEKLKNRQVSLAKDFLAGEVDSYGAERDRILNAAKNIDAVKKYAASQGISLNSFAGFLDFTQANIDLPPAIKQASENILKASGQVLKGGGKLAVVLDPIFAAQDFSKAIDTGVSGGEALSFTAQKFVQDLVNLPRTLEDLAYTATEKGTFKNFGDKENRIFDYKPKTFADDFLKNKVEKTDPKILKARLAKRDFDTQVLPNLTMVDDIDIPASKEEIGAAKDAFMQEKDVDLSVLEKPKRTPFGKYNEQIKKLVF